MDTLERTGVPDSGNGNPRKEYNAHRYQRKGEKQVIFRVTEGDHRRIKFESTRRGMSMRDFIMECVRKYLKVD